MELISIIMPAYNAEKFIEQSIDSVLSQTYNNWELIIIDDGSTDSTAEIVKKKAQLDDRIKYHYQENSKQAKARNLGLRYANGEFIAFLDADDLWLKSKLAVMINEFKLGEQDLLFADSYIFTESFDVHDCELYGNKMGVKAGEYFGYEGLSDFLELNRIPMLTVLAKSQIIKSLGFNDLGLLAEDYELWLRMLLNGFRLRAIPQPLGAYRLYESSSSSVDRLLTDYCIKIIHNLKLTTKDPYISKLIDIKIKIWYRRKLSQVKDSKQLAELYCYLKESGVRSILFAGLAMFNLNNKYVYKLQRKILKRLL